MAGRATRAALTTGLTCPDRSQTITIDGLLDTLNKEWRTDSGVPRRRRARQRTPGLLRHLEQHGPPTGLAWYGWWTLDGALWGVCGQRGGGPTALVESLTVGARCPLASWPTTPSTSTSPTTATVYHFTAGAWQAQTIPGFTFAQGRSGGTEIRLPWTLGSVSSLKLLAYAIGDDAEVTSIFPNATTPWSGPVRWTAHAWSSPCAVAVVNQAQ